MSFWDAVQNQAKRAGDATKVAAQKTKLHADMMLIDRDIQQRKQQFGVTMYDYISPLSQKQDFYAATDDLTTMLRPPLITAQKEIQALAIKRVKCKEALAQAEAARYAAFPTKAESWGEKFLNAGKASVMHGNETKIKTELAMVDRRIKAIKQQFGLDLFQALVDAEDKRGYLPSDRQVRSIYDQARGDVHKLELKKQSKREQLEALGGISTEPFTNPDVNHPPSDDTMGYQSPSFNGVATSSGTAHTTTTGDLLPASHYKDDPEPDAQEDLLL